MRRQIISSFVGILLLTACEAETPASTDHPNIAAPPTPVLCTAIANNARDVDTCPALCDSRDDVFVPPAKIKKVHGKVRMSCNCCHAVQ